MHRLLLVDDDEMNLDMLARRLERQGYQVERANSGQQALSRVRQQRPDLMLLDYHMPNITGLDVLRIVRQKHSAGVLPVIIVTASTDPKTVMDALKLGANDFIAKPVDLAILLKHLQIQLSHRKDVT